MSSKKAIVEMNNAGVQSVLKSSEMQAMIKSVASAKWGDVEVLVRSTRAIGKAYGDDGNNSLLKGMNK